MLEQSCSSCCSCDNNIWSEEEEEEDSFGQRRTRGGGGGLQRGSKKHGGLNINLTPGSLGGVGGGGGQLPLLFNSIPTSTTLLPLDFISVLIHQHAKTLVALKNLRSEVNQLKCDHGESPSPSSSKAASFLKIKPGGGLVTKGTATGFGTATIISSTDSGLFSTKSTSTTSGDELYSLLSQIQERVATLKTQGQGGQERKPTLPLGHLDDVFGNRDFDFKKFSKIEKAVVKVVLGCEDLGELRRQVLFERAKNESLGLETLKLKMENMSLKSKMKELEEQVEKPSSSSKYRRAPSTSLPRRSSSSASASSSSPRHQNQNPPPSSVIISSSSLLSENKRSLIPIRIQKRNNINKTVNPNATNKVCDLETNKPKTITTKGMNNTKFPWVTSVYGQWFGNGNSNSNT